jgi:HD-GYP domain-containing protein (c-di-GMP phosphodiesterase class II)
MPCFVGFNGLFLTWTSGFAGFAAFTMNERANVDDQNRWIIETSDLEIGAKLGFDIKDTEGNVLHKAGMPITKRLLDRLAEKKMQAIQVERQEEKQVEFDRDSVSATLLGAFPHETIVEIQATISRAEKAIRDLIEPLSRRETVSASKVRVSIDQFAEQASEHAEAALAVLAARILKAPPEITEKLIARSATLAFLGITTGVMMELNEDDIEEIGLVGFLHDSSLLVHPEWFQSSDGIVGNPILLADYRNHPIESCELLQGGEGISERILKSISQVHEQCDGSGFPAGVSIKQLLVSSRILNVSDAYLSLVQPFFATEQFHCADAIAYLCYHAARQCFDPQVVRGFIIGQSMYPVGTPVMLDDDSIAVVIQSHVQNPMEPTVQLLDGIKKIIDLSSSQQTIVGPAYRQDFGAERIPKSRMDELLWNKVAK